MRQLGIALLILLVLPACRCWKDGPAKRCWETTATQGLGGSELPPNALDGLEDDRQQSCSETIAGQSFDRALWKSLCNDSFETYIINGVCQTQVPDFCAAACPSARQQCEVNALPSGEAGGRAHVMALCARANFDRFVAANRFCEGHTLAGIVLTPPAGGEPNCSIGN